MNNRIALPIVTVIALAAVLPLAFGGNKYYLNLLVLTAVYALLGLSVNLPGGYLGYLSFGHAAFFGLGGYTATLLSMFLGVNFWLAAIIAIIPGLLLGVLIGFASLRVGGAYFAITSLTVAEILRLIADNWIDLTRGPMGLIVRRPTIPFLDSLGLSFAQYHLAIAILLVGVAFIIVRLLLMAPGGRAWLAIRGSSDLAESVGIPTISHQVQNLALSGAFASLAGALLVPRVLVVSPDLFSPIYSATGILIMLLGGRGTLLGPIIGGALFAIVPEMLRFIDDFRIPIFAVLILVLVRIRPDGVAPLLLQPMARLTAPRAAGRSEPSVCEPSRTAAEPGEIILSAEKITKRYRGLVAVNEVSFDIRRGEIIGLMGPNGAGKTTCLSLISGFLPPTAGTIRFLGREISNQPPHLLAKAGLVRTFQHTTLFMRLTAFENVLIAAGGRQPSGLLPSLFRTGRFAAEERRRRALATYALARVGLSDRAAIEAGALSYGDQRLLSVALALAAEPQLLLLDEPAAGLNPAEAERLAEVIRSLKAEGLTIVLVEHNVPMLMSLSDRLVVLHHGELIMEGRPEEVARDSRVRKAYLGGVVHV